MKTAIALGTFDGVHKGHRAVLDLPREMKKIAVIFALPPKAILSGEPKAIMTGTDKCRVLKEIGIDEIFTLDFNEVRGMVPEDFLLFLKEKFSPSLISCGFNYRFGKNAAGNTDDISDFCALNGIEFKCCKPVSVDGKPVSSTEIRRFLSGGDIQRANMLLFEPFSFTAEVTVGDRRGRTLGFPTINQKYPKELIPIKFGVYKTKIRFDNSQYNGITNIGIRPTWQTDYIISETYIENFSGDLYGKSVTVIPMRFIRGEVKFSSAEALVSQIKSDLNS